MSGAADKRGLTTFESCREKNKNAFILFSTMQTVMLI